VALTDKAAKVAKPRQKAYKLTDAKAFTLPLSSPLNTANTGG
jgi:hypothetical protein